MKQFLPRSSWENKCQDALNDHASLDAVLFSWIPVTVIFINRRSQIVIVKNRTKILSASSTRTNVGTERALSFLVAIQFANNAICQQALSFITSLMREFGSATATTSTTQTTSLVGANLVTMLTQPSQVASLEVCRRGAQRCLWCCGRTHFSNVESFRAIFYNARNGNRHRGEICPDLYK
jgi:hypothetical protein